MLKHPLSQIAPGKKGVIKGFKTDDVPAKFYEMGLLPGAHFTLEHKAPFHGPVCITLAGSLHKLALRYAEADLVWVDIEEHNV